MADPGSAGSFATLTHARLRAAQGDVAGAARILRVILKVQPGHDEARTLLDRLEERGTPRREEAPDEPIQATQPAAAADLAERFRGSLGTRRDGRAARLSRWLESARRNRRRERVR